MFWYRERYRRLYTYVKTQMDSEFVDDVTNGLVRSPENFNSSWAEQKACYNIVVVVKLALVTRML